MFQGGYGGDDCAAGTVAGGPVVSALSRDPSLDRDPRDAPPAQATVVRTQSHLARFNTARAMFEKMGQSESSSGTEERARRFRSLGNSQEITKSEVGPTSLAMARLGLSDSNKYTRSVGHGQTNGHVLSPPGGVVFTTTTTTTTTATQPLNSTTTTPSLHRTHPPNHDPLATEEVKLRKPNKPEKPERISSIKGPPSPGTKPAKPAKPTNFGTNAFPKRDSDSESCTISPPMSDTESNSNDRRPSSHHELVQRHKNWFQTFSRNKSPSSSPVKTDVTSPSRTPEPRSPRSSSGSDYYTERRKEGRYASCEELDDCRPNRGSFQQTSVKSSSTDSLLSGTNDKGNGDFSNGYSNGEDWRKERAAILRGRSSSKYSRSVDESNQQKTDDGSVAPNKPLPPAPFKLNKSASDRIVGNRSVKNDDASIEKRYSDRVTSVKSTEVSTKESSITSRKTKSTTDSETTSDLDKATNKADRSTNEINSSTTEVDEKSSTDGGVSSKHSITTISTSTSDEMNKKFIKECSTVASSSSKDISNISSIVHVNSSSITCENKSKVDKDSLLLEQKRRADVIVSECIAKSVAIKDSVLESSVNGHSKIQTQTDTSVDVKCHKKENITSSKSNVERYKSSITQDNVPNIPSIPTTRQPPPYHTAVSNSRRRFSNDTKTTNSSFDVDQKISDSKEYDSFNKPKTQTNNPCIVPQVSVVITPPEVVVEPVNCGPVEALKAETVYVSSSEDVSQVEEDSQSSKSESLVQKDRQSSNHKESPKLPDSSVNKENNSPLSQQSFPDIIPQQSTVKSSSEFQKDILKSTEEHIKSSSSNTTTIVTEHTSKSYVQSDTKITTEKTRSSIEALDALIQGSNTQNKTVSNSNNDLQSNENKHAQSRLESDSQNTFNETQVPSLDLHKNNQNYPKYPNKVFSQDEMSKSPSIPLNKRSSSLPESDRVRALHDKDPKASPPMSPRRALQQQLKREEEERRVRELKELEERVIKEEQQTIIEEEEFRLVEEILSQEEDLSEEDEMYLTDAVMRKNIIPLDDVQDIIYDHTVLSAQHKIQQFCKPGVGISDYESEPEPLPPPIPPHSVDPASLIIEEKEPIPSPKGSDDPEFMTQDEADRLLSDNIIKDKTRDKSGRSLLSDAEAREVTSLLSSDATNTPACPIIVPPSPEEQSASSESSTDPFTVTRIKEVLVDDGVHYLEDGHFWVEVPGLADQDDEDDLDPSVPFHAATKIRFSDQPIQLFSTYSVNDYDRKNDDVDPVAASAEYELEKRVEKMEVFPVEIEKGDGGLGLSIIGMGVGADAGVEKLGIFVKTITPGGATERDNRIRVNDQIIEVDNKSLVGVTQLFAASVLKNTSGKVNFIIGREKDPENSEVAMLIRQSLQADKERDERRRALGGPDYDLRGGLYEPALSSPSEENSQSEDFMPHHNPPSYGLEDIQESPPTSTGVSQDNYDYDQDATDTSPDNHTASLKLKLKEAQYRSVVYEAEVTKLKLKMADLTQELNEKYDKVQSQYEETSNKLAQVQGQLNNKQAEISTYQDMLESSQGQYILLEKKYYKAKKIIKEYQSRERDFLHREEYHITQLEEKDTHYNALVKALKDRVIQLESDLSQAQKKAGIPIQIPSDASAQHVAYLHQKVSSSAPNPAKMSASWRPIDTRQIDAETELSDTEPSDSSSSVLGAKSNTVERKVPIKEELDDAVPQHELLDVSASRAKSDLVSRGGLANRQLPSLKKTSSMSSAGSLDQSGDELSLEEDLPESDKQVLMDIASSPSIDSSLNQSISSPQQETSPQRPHIPYRHPPPVARVQPVNRAEISSMQRPPSGQVQSQGVANQLKNLLTTQRDVPNSNTNRSYRDSPGNSRDSSPTKRMAMQPSFMEEMRQAMNEADITLGNKPVLSSPLHLPSTAHVVPTGQVMRGSTTSAPHYHQNLRDNNPVQDNGMGNCKSPKQGQVSSNVNCSGGIVLLSQRPLDSSLPPNRSPEHLEVSSGPGSLGSGDEGSGTSLESRCSPTVTRDPHSPSDTYHSAVYDWTTEQVSHWLVLQGLEGCVGKFLSAAITGPRLINMDAKDLKNLSLNTDEKNRLKRKVKELRLSIEKERKQVEKEKKEKEKLQKKAEKLAEKAEKRKK